MQENKPLIEITENDRRFYAENIESFLPDKIIDIHTHLWRQQDFPRLRPTPANSVSWPALVAADNPIEDLQETYRLMLPGKTVTPLIFANVPADGNLDAQNRYIQNSASQYNLPSLIFSDPAWSAEELEKRIISGGFIGAKSYLSLAPSTIPAEEITIFDFFPHHQLQVHNRHGWVVMLHIPRSGRLRDTVNLSQLIQIENEYPNIKLIVAHVGRAYCNEDIGDAFNILTETKTINFDISANTNDYVFEQLLRCVGPKRVLFGSDMPILRMRMRRITRDGHYVNLVQKGLYGDVSNDKNMAEVSGEEATNLTFFLYEEINAFRHAAHRTGLTRDEINDVFYGNAKRMIGEIL